MNLLKALTLSLALTASLTACQSQTSEVTTTGDPDGSDMTPNPVIPADTTIVDPAAADAMDGDNNMMAPSPDAAAADGAASPATGTGTMTNGQ